MWWGKFIVATRIDKVVVKKPFIFWAYNNGAKGRTTGWLVLILGVQIWIVTAMQSMVFFLGFLFTIMFVYVRSFATFKILFIFVRMLSLTMTMLFINMIIIIIIIIIMLLAVIMSMIMIATRQTAATFAVHLLFDVSSSSIWVILDIEPMVDFLLAHLELIHYSASLISMMTLFLKNATSN